MQNNGSPPSALAVRPSATAAANPSHVIDVGSHTTIGCGPSASRRVNWA